MRIKTIILAVIFSLSPLLARPATDEDIARVLREMDKRFELVEKRFEQIDKRFEQIDKRFEQIDKRFEQIDKRFEFIQALLIALLLAVVGSPFLVEYLARRREIKGLEAWHLSQKIITALREVAEKNPALEKALKHVGLL